MSIGKKEEEEQSGSSEEPLDGIKDLGSSTFSVVHCGGDVEFTDGEVEHGD